VNADTLFSALHVTGDGAVRRDDFVRAFGSQGALPNEHPRARSRSRSPSGGDDAAQLHEAFERVCSAMETAGMTAQQGFQSFDRDGSGSISVAEFMTLMRSLCERSFVVDARSHTAAPYELPRRTLLRMLTTADRNVDRRVTEREFVQLLSSVWPHRYMRAERSSCLSGGSGSVKVWTLQELDRVEALLVKSFGPDFRSLAMAGARHVEMDGAFTALHRVLHRRTRSDTTAAAAAATDVESDADDADASFASLARGRGVGDTWASGLASELLPASTARPRSAGSRSRRSQSPEDIPGHRAVMRHRLQMSASAAGQGRPVTPVAVQNVHTTPVLPFFR
jgi:Ca2+-binding EF-hand superfamily protein